MKVTTEWLNDYLNAPTTSLTVNNYAGFPYKELKPRIECLDNAVLSIQASERHYSLPRENTAEYTAAEVGFPDPAPPDTWQDYFTNDWDKDDRTGSVYGYVPLELIVAYINDHGGLQSNE